MRAVARLIPLKRAAWRGGWLWASAAAMAATAAVAAELSIPLAAPPNVILIMADDLGWGDVGFNGNERVRTPHLDAMAKESLVFSRFYAAAPVCSPTRGSALTGRHPHRYGIVHANAGHLPAEEVTLAEFLKERGYVTGHFGKWHLGTLTRTVRDSNRGGPSTTGREHFAPPQAHGFDVCFSTEAKVPTHAPLRMPAAFAPDANRTVGWDALEPGEAWKPYGTRYWDERGDEVRDALLDDDSKEIMSRALPFVERAAQDGSPFFAVIWFHAPHLPVVAAERHREPYRDLSLHERNYFGCITALDEQVGRLRASLRTLGVAENTMIWFCSDNGPEGRAKTSPGSATPFRGRKRDLLEGGVRVPALLEWPAMIEHARRTEVAAVTSDYFPTVREAVSLAQGEDEKEDENTLPLDGASLMPLIRGEMEARLKPIGFYFQGKVAWHEGHWKCLFRQGDPDESAELYHLGEDPGETRDRAAEQPELTARMKAAAEAWVMACEP